MVPPRPDNQATLRELERVLGSDGFARSQRLSRFLRYVVEQSLEGREGELKESVIALEVFGRNGDYDPKLDSIVRTEAGRLRARLTEYYSQEGLTDPIVLELPKGGYVPLVRERDAVQEQVQNEPREGTTPHYPRRWIALTAAGLLSALAVAGGWWWHHRTSEPVTIAVLPLESLSPDPANDYFADGLTDEILRNLSVIDGLAVRSHTSSFAFKGKPTNVHDVARQLNVDYILEGSVLRDGSRLRINAQLVRARDDVPLWAGQFDRQLTDVFAIQDEISRGIVNNLRLKLGGRRRYETSIEAYDPYLRARALLSHGGFATVSPPAIDLFEESIAKDPSFAPAYAGLASVYAVASSQGAAPDGFDISENLAKMRTAAERAIQLDPLLAEGYEALGTVGAREGQMEESENAFRRAIELDPNLSMAYDEFAMDLLLPLNRIEEALREARIAERTDPLSPTAQQVLAYVLISAERYDEAVQHCEKLPTEFSGKSECLGRARLGQGRVDEAIQILAAGNRATAVNNPTVRGYLGYAYGRAGRREMAENLAASIPPPNNFNQALIFAGLGDKDRTLEALDRMTQLGPFRIGRMLAFPELALLRGDPRVKDLRKKAGLPE
jgi:TolB-like protein